MGERYCTRLIRGSRKTNLSSRNEEMFAILGFRLLRVSSCLELCSGSNRFQETASEKHTFLSRSVQTAVDRLSHLSGCLHQSCRESSQRCQTQAAFTGCLLGNNENINEQSLKGFWKPVRCAHVQYIIL